MKNRAAFGFMLLLAGCGASSVKTAVAPGHEMMIHNQIALAPVPDFPGAAGSGQAATNEWVRQMMSGKITVQVLEGGGFQAARDQARAKGFNYFIVASYTRYQKDQKYVINQVPNQVSTYYPPAYGAQPYVPSPYSTTNYPPMPPLGTRPYGGAPTPISGGTPTTSTTMGSGLQQQILTSNASVGMTAQMLEVATGNIIWTGAYTYEALDVESAVEGIASNLVGSLPGPK